MHPTFDDPMFGGRGGGGGGYDGQYVVHPPSLISCFPTSREHCIGSFFYACYVLLMCTSSLSAGSRQARDTIPLVPATDLHRGEADYVSLVVVEEGSVEEEHHRTRLGALVVMISFDDSCWYRAGIVHHVFIW